MFEFITRSLAVGVPVEQIAEELNTIYGVPTSRVWDMIADAERLAA